MSAEMCAVDSLDVPLSGGCSFIYIYLYIHIMGLIICRCRNSSFACFQGTSQIAQAATMAQLVLWRHSARRLLAVAGAITPVAIV